MDKDKVLKQKSTIQIFIKGVQVSIYLKNRDFFMC